MPSDLFRRATVLQYFIYGGHTMEIKIFDKNFRPEIIDFSATVSFACESASQSGIKKAHEWINHFITLRSVNPEGADDYSNCLTILKKASFSEANYVEIEHDNKTISLTFHFKSLDNLNKFVDTLKEEIRS